MLVDDHTVLRSGLRLLVNSQADMEVVAEADNSRDVLEIATKFRPDVVVLDLSLPGGPSIPVIERLNAMGVPSRVLVLTMHDDPAYVRAALGAGAKGFVVKTIGEQELLQAIRSVQQGRLVVDLDDASRTAQVFQSPGSRGSAAGLAAASRLSSREIEVVRLLGQGFSNLEVAEKLDLSPKTVATYRARIGEKLGLRTTAEFVKYAIDTGMTGSQLD